MKLRSLTTLAAGAAAAVAGLAAPATAKSAPATGSSVTETVHTLTAAQARAKMAEMAAKPGARSGTRAFVRSAGSVTPDASSGSTIPIGCQGTWSAAKAGNYAYGLTKVSCSGTPQKKQAGVVLSRLRWYGWSYLGRDISTASDNDPEALAYKQWGCQGVGTYTYRNNFLALTSYGGKSGSIQSRFAC